MTLSSFGHMYQQETGSCLVNMAFNYLILFFGHPTAIGRSWHFDSLVFFTFVTRRKLASVVLDMFLTIKLRGGEPVDDM